MHKQLRILLVSVPGQRMVKVVVCLILWLYMAACSYAWFLKERPRVPLRNWLGIIHATSTQTHNSAHTTQSNMNDVQSLAASIEDRIANKIEPEPLLCQLEEKNTNREPNRDSNSFGTWHVYYTNAPPPSNGELGPFRGGVKQSIQDASTKSYKNLLSVPPYDWLSAVLEGIWEEWDGIYLDSDDDNDKSCSNITSEKRDWGTDHWKVTFLNLKITLFQKFTIVNTVFPPNTSRVWRTTYLDDEIRIVRAGKTGRRKDEVIFYTKRAPFKSSL